MNVAFSALLVFLLLLPGFLFRTYFKRAEKVVLDIKPFGQAAIDAFLAALVLDLVWYWGAALVTGYRVDFKVLLTLVAGDKSANLDSAIAEDVAFAESRIRAETIAAEDVLHDLGAISMMSSDSQAMGRIGEVICRTWQTADKMKRQRGPLPGETAASDNLRVRRPGEQEQQIAADLVPSPEEDSLTYLRAIVLGGVQPSGLSSLQTNLVVTEILDAARQSATSGKAVHLAPRD